jgi:hypothetical protein
VWAGKKFSEDVLTNSQIAELLSHRESLVEEFNDLSPSR